MRKLLVLIFCVLAIIAAESSIQSEPLPTSTFQADFAQLNLDNSVFAQTAQQYSPDQGGSGTAAAKHLVPGKAFAMSLLVPGLGQWYNGSKIKAVGFLALDVTSWVLHFKNRSDGNKLTDEFNAFADKYWAQSRYEYYLNGAYGKSDDDSITASEVSHHLPDTKTQQYYEMIGKYDQFSWGWDDATLNGLPLDQQSPVLPVVTGSIPTSNHRFQYEDMRLAANNKFDAADKWLIVMMANHVISAFDALVSAKRHNNANGTGFGRVKVKADLRSYAAEFDTPYLKVGYAF